MSTYIEIVLILQNCVTFTRIVLSVVSAKLGVGGLKPIFAMPRRQKQKKTKPKKQDKMSNVVVIGLLLARYFVMSRKYKK